MTEFFNFVAGERDVAIDLNLVDASFCFMKGIRIPADVSVICLDDQKLFNWLKPRPTYMRYPRKPRRVIFKNGSKAA